MECFCQLLDVLQSMELVLKDVIDPSSGFQREIGYHGHCMVSIKGVVAFVGIVVIVLGEGVGRVGNTGRLSFVHLPDLTVVVIRCVAEL